MKKSGIVLLSAVGTLGIVVGSVGVVNNIPQTKGKLNISFGDTSLIGKNDNKLEVVNPGNLESELEKINYVMLNYKNGEETISSIVEKGSMLEILQSNDETQTFIGWSSELGKNNIVLSAEKSSDLYPVYVNNPEHDIKIHLRNKYDTQATPGYVPTVDNYALSSLIGRNLSANVSGSTFTGYVIAISELPGSIVPVTEFSAEKEYYGIFYCENENRVMSYDEFNDSYENFRCGGYAFKDVNIHTVTGVSVVKAREVVGLYNGGSFVYNGNEYRLAGFSTSAESTTTLSKWSTPDYSVITDLYAVYNGPDGKVNVSTLPIISFVNAYYVISAWESDYTKISINSDELSGYVPNMNLIPGGDVTINLAGYAISETSTDIIDSENLTAEYFANNNITELYAVYERSDNNELISSLALKNIVINNLTYNVYYFAEGGYQQFDTVYFLNSREQNVSHNGEEYTFAGWTDSPDSVSTLTNYMPNSTYYAVYQNSDGELKTINDIING